MNQFWLISWYNRLNYCWLKQAMPSMILGCLYISRGELFNLFW